MLGLDSAVQDDLRFRLHPSLNSDEFSRCLKRDSNLHLGQKIGLADYRDIQSAFVNKHKDPEALLVSVQDSAADLQQGHTSDIRRRFYGLTSDKLQGVPEDRITGFVVHPNSGNAS